MAIISKRKRVLLAFTLAASISHGFVLAPNVKVIASETLKSIPTSLSVRNTAFRPLQVFWGKQQQDGVATTEGTSNVDNTAGALDIFLTNPFEKKLPDERTAGRLSIILARAEGVIRPAANLLDDATDGWALTYADLSPENQTTPIGQAFLASNLAYAAAGLALSIQGDLFLGLLVEFASVASFVYHYTQLDESSRNDTVQLALFVDYVMAFTSIFAGLGYILMDGQIPPMEGLLSASIAMSFFLLGCTVCAEGMAYVVVHSLWHVFSAYCGYLVGTNHLANMM